GSPDGFHVFVRESPKGLGPCTRGQASGFSSCNRGSSETLRPIGLAGGTVRGGLCVISSRFWSRSLALRTGIVVGRFSVLWRTRFVAHHTSMPARASAVWHWISSCGLRPVRRNKSWGQPPVPHSARPARRLEKKSLAASC